MSKDILDFFLVLWYNMVIKLIWRFTDMVNDNMRVGSNAQNIALLFNQMYEGQYDDLDDTTEDDEDDNKED